LIDVRELSRLTSLSVRTLRRMDSCGDIPGRVVVRRRVRFQLAAIREWVAAGCPTRN
jgi:predicted DNA-binding transcriptional regulator AlpA